MERGFYIEGFPPQREKLGDIRLREKEEEYII
jgi:hypothetical protein